jgi:hypothetical protein
MSKNVTDLRNILFDAIEGVRSGNLDIDKAKTINELSKTLVDTARAENDHARYTGGIATSEFMAPKGAPALPGQTHNEATASGTKTITHLAGGATITQHKMRG